MDSGKFIKRLKVEGEKLGYLSKISPGGLVISRVDTFLKLHVQIHEERVFLYLYGRASSWDADGERTDINDILTFLPCIFLKVNGINISSVLFNIEHPMGQGDYGAIPEVEIYGRYVSFQQPFNESLLPRTKDSLDFIMALIHFIALYEFSLHKFIDGDENTNAKYSCKDLNLHVWAMSISKALDIKHGIDSITYNLRVNPTWYYFRSFKHSISVVHSRKTSVMLRNLISEMYKFECYETDGHVFVKTGNVFNSYLTKDSDIILRVFKELESTAESVIFVPIENRLFGIGQTNIISLEREVGKRSYTLGKEIVVKRRVAEQEFLFKGKVYSWNDRIDGNRFEELTRDLLLRKNGIIKVITTSVTNEPDANADLICIWDSLDLMDMPQSKERGPLRKRKVVVQCKAWSKNIGKNDIPSIRDTLDRFDAEGMLVVTSKSITRSLFDHFEMLRRKGIWADYWGRAEIEGLLDENPDVVDKYPDIVTFDMS